MSNREVPEIEGVKLRQVAPYGDKLLVSVDPGSAIHDLQQGGKLIGLVTPGHQIENEGTIYMTHDDFELVARVMASRAKAH